MPGELPARSKHERPDFEAIKDKALQGVASGAGWLRNVEDKAEAIASVGKQAIPSDQNSNGKELSPLTKALIAILVPLIIIVVAALVFFNRGEDHEYAYYLTQAQASVSNALMQPQGCSGKVGNKPWVAELAALTRTLQSEACACAQTALDDLMAPGVCST